MRKVAKLAPLFSNQIEFEEPMKKKVSVSFFSLFFLLLSFTMFIHLFFSLSLASSAEFETRSFSNHCKREDHIKMLTTNIQVFTIAFIRFNNDY